MRLARRCLAAVREPVLVEGVTLNVAASIGVALAPQRATASEAMMRAADLAMYEAKGGTCEVAVYDPERDVRTPARPALLGDPGRPWHDDELSGTTSPTAT